MQVSGLWIGLQGLKYVLNLSQNHSKSRRSIILAGKRNNWCHSCRIAGEATYQVLKVLSFQFPGVSSFLIMREKKNEVKSCPHSRSRPRIWVTASPFRRQSFDLSQVPLSPRNIHICKAWAGKVKCNRFFGLQIESSEKLRVIRSRLPPSLICSLLATGCALQKYKAFSQANPT